MKFGEQTSIGHNIADSFASGIGLMIGTYRIQIFEEAATTPEGFITVDFLTGTSDGGSVSSSLARAIELYRDALPELCKRHGAEVQVFAVLTARYGVDVVQGPVMTVTVEDRFGRRSVDQYAGDGGRRLHGRG